MTRGIRTTDLHFRRVTTFPFVQIRENSWLTITIEDWSAVRSPGRARRRRRQGYRQNVAHRIVPDPKVYTMPNGDMVCHPATLKTISDGIGEQIRERHDRQFLNAVYEELS